MTVSVQEFNEVRGEVDPAVKAALEDFAARLKTASNPAFEIEHSASAIEEVFERAMVDEFRPPICKYCAAAIPRWIYAGQYWHRLQYIEPTPVAGARPITIPTLGAVPDRVGCTEPLE